jgi:hypothetical protein
MNIRPDQTFIPPIPPIPPEATAEGGEALERLTKRV